MLRTTVSKAMWVGKATVFLVGLAVILALIFGAVSRATAHTGSAGLFHLNHNNPVTALSKLTGTLAGAVLKVDNNGAGPALSLEAESGKAPLTVNSTAGKATNLNADKIDGLDSSAFVKGASTISYGKVDIPAGTNAPIITTSNPDLRISYSCPSSPQTANGVLLLSYSGQEPVNVFFDRKSSSSTQHFLLEQGGLTSLSASVQSTEHATYQAQGTNLATMEVFTVERTSDCHTQAQALVTR